MLLEKFDDSERNRLRPGSAAPSTSSSRFRSTARQDQPKAKRWDHQLSVESSARTNSTLKASTRATGPGDTISLGVARPHWQYYPWEALDIHSLTTSVGKDGIITKPADQTSCLKGQGAYDFAAALNYGASAGSPPLLQFITEHVELIHNPPYADWECSLTCGTTSALEMVFRMLCNRDDHIITEAFTYSGALEAAKPLGLNVVPIEMDSNGLVPEALDASLQSWKSGKGPKPHVLYTIPTGQNPTGVTQPTTRRRAIYEVAERHDLIIIEDDPYYFMSLGICPHGGQKGECTVLSPDEFLKTLPPSYLSFDASGRVIRLDTASKILAPGLRCGWISACSQLIEKFLNHSEFSTTSTSGPSQTMMYKLLDETWGHTGFINWLMYLSLQYRQRLHTTIEACRVYLPGELCRWNLPSFGMFVWIEVDWRKHPLARVSDKDENEDNSWLEIEDKIHSTAKQNGVQVSKGSWFAAETGPRPTMNFRITFAAAPREEHLEQAVARFGRTIRKEFGLEPAIDEGRNACDVSVTQIQVCA